MGEPPQLQDLHVAPLENIGRAQKRQKKEHEQCMQPTVRDQDISCQLHALEVGDLIYQ